MPARLMMVLSLPYRTQPCHVWASYDRTWLLFGCAQTTGVIVDTKCVTNPNECTADATVASTQLKLDAAVRFRTACVAGGCSACLNAAAVQLMCTSMYLHAW